MFNLVVLTGRLTADPELKTTQSGISVTSFSIAVSRRYKAGEETQADFIPVVAWRQSAEFIAKYFKKGSMIGIEGSIQTRKYTDKNGNNRTAFEVVANNVQFVESKKENVELNYLKDNLENAGVPTNADFEDVGDASDDDLPF